MTVSKTYRGNLHALILVVATGCVGEPARQHVDSAIPVSALERQIVLTVPQRSSEAFRFTGMPGRPYIKRSSYGSSRATERVLDQLAADYALQRIDGWQITSLGVYCEVFEIAAGGSIDETLARLKSDTRVESAQTMNVFSVLARRGYSACLANALPT